MRVMRLGRSPAWRAGAVVAAIAVAGAAWYLGSPLFIRTTLNEELPSAAPATAAASPGATAAGTGGAATSAPTAGGVVILAEGDLQFVDQLHNGKGPVRIVRLGEQRLVRFEDVMITNAPDVHVYLSLETGGKWSETTSLYLGALKATDGSFHYEIPASADASVYKSVVVWCRAFATLITYADLSVR